MRKLAILSGAALAVVLAVGPTADANAMFARITFDDNIVTGGTVSYAGGAAPLVGTAIELDRIKGTDTPSNDNVALNCADGGGSCLLSFSTGANGGGGIPGSLDAWSGGGFVTISGTASPGVGGGQSGTLLSGSFVGAVGAFEQPGGGDVIVAGFFSGFIDAVLAGFFGVPAGGDGSLTQISFSVPAGTIGSGVAFSTTTSEVDVKFNPVPIPGAVWLFGSGVLGLLGIGYTRRRQAAA